VCPFIMHLLDRLEAAGWREVVLCTGYLSEQVEAALGSQYKSLRLTYSVEHEPLGTAGALRLAVEQVEADSCLVMNGDSFVDADLAAFRHWHEAHTFPGSLLLTYVNDAARFGTVEVTEEGRIHRFLEKQGKAEPGWINAGVYLLPCVWLQALSAGQAISIERECFPAWVQRGLGGFRTRSNFIDIGTPESLKRAALIFASSVANQQETS